MSNLQIFVELQYKALICFARMQGGRFNAQGDRNQLKLEVLRLRNTGPIRVCCPFAGIRLLARSRWIIVV